MALTIDNLEIQIQAEAKKATGGIDALAASMKKLESALGNSGGIVSNLTQIANALKSLSSNSIGKINLAAPIKQIGALKEIIPAFSGEDATRFAQNLKEIASGFTAFSTVKGLSITPVANGIKSLCETAKTLDIKKIEPFVQQMKHIAAGLSSLSGVGKTNIGSVVNALNKIPDITATLKPEVIEQFSEKVKKLTAIMSPLADEMDKIARGFNAMPNAIKRATKAGDQAATSNKKLKSSFSDLTTQLSHTASKYRNLYYTATRIADVFADWFNESNEYIEAMNLFTVSMGDATDAAIKYANSVSEALGIDPSDWMQNQGVFMRMATGFGVTSEKAEVMSQNLTQLAYDLSSFFNTDVQTAMQKLQSGMSGQIKGLKAWGYNLSVAALQETALSLGIEQSVRSMSEAEKAQLRYITLIQRSKGIMGDMAKTITSPANAMRVLDAQMTKLKRSLGNLVSVLVTQFIPWIMAAVEMVTELAEELAEAWGFEVPEFPEVDLELGSESIEETEEELSALKKQLMGFDELNILKNDDKNGAESWLNNFNLPEYDFLNGLKGLDLEPYKQKLREMLDLVGKIAAVMFAWKVGSGLTNFLSGDLPKLMNLFKTSRTTMPMLASDMSVAATKATTFADKMLIGAGAILSVAGAFFEFKGVQDALAEGFDFKNVAQSVVGSGSVVAGGAMIGKAFGSAAKGAAVGMMASGLTMFVPATVDAIKEGVDLESILLSTGGGALTGAGIGMLFGPVGAGIGAAIGAGVGAATQGITALVQECTSDCIEAVEIFDDTISETTREKVEPFLDSMRELSDLSFKWEVTDQKFATAEQITAWSNELAKLEGIDVLSAEEVDRIRELKELLSDTTGIEDFTTKIDSLINTIQSGLIEKKNAFGESLLGLTGLDSETYASAMSGMEEFYKAQEKTLEDHKKRIAEIMKGAADKNRSLTKSEWTEINDIQAKMQDMGVKTLSDSAIEYETIMRNLKDNSTRVSLEQASEIIKNAQTTRDETIAAAEAQYSTILLEAKQMWDMGAINEDTYRVITEAAKSTRDETVAAANDQYAKILSATKDKLGEMSKYIDEETGEIKSNWDIFWEDLGEACSDFWDWLTDGWDVTWATFKNIFKGNGYNGGGFDFSELNGYASGGFPTMGEMFIARERGPELVGRIGNKNAVANNNQITAGIASAVYSAMMAAKEDGDNGGSSARIVVQIGETPIGEAAVRFINGQIVQTGVSPIYG